MKFPPDVKAALIEMAESKGVRLEGNMLKMIDVEADDPQFIEYINESIEKDQESRKKRLEMMKQLQAKNKELLEAQEKLSVALSEAEKAKDVAENAKAVVQQDLEVLQKRTQFHMMKRIVNLSLGVVASVGVITTGVYLYAIAKDREIEHIGTVWASLIGILLTNSFSILGTIMGVKYSTNKED